MSEYLEEKNVLDTVHVAFKPPLLIRTESATSKGTGKFTVTISVQS